MKQLVSFGGPLSVFQLANLAILYSATIMIGAKLGPGAVTAYSVPYSAFAVIVAAVYLVATPYTPAYAEAKARGDLNWISRRLRTLIIWCAGTVALGSGILILAGPRLIPWWTSGAVTADRGFLTALGVFAIVRAASNSHSVMLTGVGRVRLTAAVFAIAAVVFVVSSWILLPRYGITAVPIGGIAGHLVTLVPGWNIRKLR